MTGLYLAAFASACLCAEIRIHDIQGRAHQSPLVGDFVQGVPGIVTALRPNGFYMQDDVSDGDPATSEGVFVYGTPIPAVKTGDAVRVSGTVVEFRRSTWTGDSLSSTNIRLRTLETSAHDMPLPAPVVLGPAGRLTPAGLKSTAGIDKSSDFDPTRYAVDFYESLEGMRVRIPESRVVAPFGAFNGVMVVPEGLFTETRFSPRGALLVDAGDFNPQRLMLIQTEGRLPEAAVGDRLNEATGILDFGTGQYVLMLEAAPAWLEAKLAPESARVAAQEELSIATYNVENLSARDAPLKFERIAAQITLNLRSPDIVGLLEVQDDNGARDDGNTNAAQTLNKLIAEIRRVGGPAYAWSAVDPLNNADGGQPGGNIRQVLLFNPQRVVLTQAAFRLGMDQNAFLQSRKPLVAIFDFHGRALTVVLNHLLSKRGDGFKSGLEVAFPPPSEPQRLKQAQVVSAYVRSLLSQDAQARVIVMGDLNDFEFSPVLRVLEQVGLSNPVMVLPAQERYSYIHEGNAQMLDHILISPALLSAPAEYDIVHVNAEYPPSRRASDHDPVLLRLRLP